MVGIVSWGAYIPVYRLSQKKIAGVWGSQEANGEKAVANFDEDSVTMAVEAVLDCTRGIDRSCIDGLFLATTSAPYLEKAASALVVTATDMSRQSRTADFSSSLRAGTNAVLSAVDAVRGGSAHHILVVASDCRLGAAGGAMEQLLGNGAAALLIGDEGVIASIEGSYSASEEVFDIWRSDSDRFVHMAEPRFATAHYLSTMQATISRLMTNHSLKMQDFSKVVFNAPDPRTHTQLARALGLELKTQVQTPLFNTIGDIGAASTLLMLVAALEEAKPGERILVANYGSGCDILILQVTNAITKLSPRRGVKGHLSIRRDLPSYEKALVFQNMIQTERERRPTPEAPSPILLLRERQAVIALYGSRCRECRTVQYPPARVCVSCRAKDKMEGYRFSDKIATVFTFTKDYISLTPDPPTLEVVIDFQGGGRMVCALTDCDEGEIKIGMPVEMTFRRLYESKGITNYFWKARPIRR